MPAGRLPPGVLITRPEPGAAETARRVAALGWRPVLAPALVLAPRPFAAPRAQALLLTSRAAARSLPPTDLPVLAVGEATAAEARARGFARVVAAAGDAAALAEAAAGSLDPAAGPLLLAVGEGYGADLAADLRRRGFRVLRRVAYAAAAAPALPPEALTAMKQFGGVVCVLFFSPRSARCAMSLIKASGHAATAASMEALAISPRVAEAATRAIAPLAWRAVRVADRPDQDALLALLGPR
ncbi:MAG: uroporphyrinogen-III synthase [Paracraurococcus sp.]